MNQIEEEESIRNFLLNKTVTDIEFYIINENYFVFDENHIWVIDAGVEIGMGEESFSFGWNSEKTIYEHHFGKMSGLTMDTATTDLDAFHIEGLKNLQGKKIRDLEFQWNWYSDMDEHFEPIEPKNYIPVELIITFENGSVLQLAAIDYKLDVVNKAMKDVVFDSEGNFLVTLDHPVEISNETLLGGEEESI